ncbi:MAG: MCP four helix bundle domain-containing protein, partial [Massilia sp.]|nr:MCP four helix bundle domain-containing protein [Massilia sp.]
MSIANLRIGPRLALAFGGLCLALVFMVGQGVVMLGRVNEGTDTIVTMRMPRVAMTTRMLGEVNDIAVALRDMLLSDGADDRAQQVEEVVSSRKELDAILA